MTKTIKSVGFHRAGDPHPELEPCDFLLTEGQEFMGKLIKFGQGIKFRGERRRYIRASHFAWYIGDNYLSEALFPRVARTHIRHYDDFNYFYVRVNTSPVNINHTMKFIKSVLYGKTPYGVRTVINIFFTYLTGWGWVPTQDGTAICSGYGSEGMVGLRRDIVFDSFLHKVSPADILEYVDNPKHTLVLEDSYLKEMR